MTIRRLSLLAIVLGVSAALPVQAGDEAMIAQGKVLVEEKCARCHAIGRDDKSPHEKAPPFRDVVEIYPSENLAEALAEGIVSGHPDMPVFKFEPPQIEAFLGYLNSLSEKP
ncbi:MAG: cytochrome C [Hyphomicrobium sp. 32-62-53]|nr:MAG: cytochrome C [Hyphomicrobium sp. 12-62-95]OYY00688.1 MAG: cytochrome C [Hyphomicrobium sp. 32-62-53]